MGDRPVNYSVYDVCGNSHVSICQTLCTRACTPTNIAPLKTLHPKQVRYRQKLTFDIRLTRCGRTDEKVGESTQSEGDVDQDNVGGIHEKQHLEGIRIFSCHRHRRQITI